MKALVIIFIIISVIVASALLVVALQDLVKDIKAEKNRKQASNQSANTGKAGK